MGAACCGESGRQGGGMKPNPAFLLQTIKVKDPKFKIEYGAKMDATLAKFGGEYCVRTPKSQAKLAEGTGEYDMCALIKFPSAAKALAWSKSEAYMAIVPARKEYADTHSFIIIEGTGAVAKEEAGKKKAYLVAEFKFKNRDEFVNEYGMKVQGTLPEGAAPIVFARPVDKQYAYKEEETTIDVSVYIEFPSAETALAWKNGEAYKKIEPVKFANSEVVSFEIYEFEDVPMVEQLAKKEEEAKAEPAKEEAATEGEPAKEEAATEGEPAKEEEATKS